MQKIMDICVNDVCETPQGFLLLFLTGCRSEDLMGVFPLPNAINFLMEGMKIRI
jgi:hypothetical protein